MIRVFYHNDLDGKCAAHIIDTSYESPTEMSFVEMDYGREFPLNMVDKGDKVFIVDYSIEPEIMEQLQAKCEAVIWIDHHKTAIEKYEDYPKNISGLRSVDYAGCVLTWFYMNGLAVIDDVPAYIRMIGDRDTWQWKYGDRTRYYCSGAELYNLNPLESFNWSVVMEETDYIIEQGKTVEKYKTQHNREFMEAFSYKTTLDGHSAIAVNMFLVGAEVFAGQLEDVDIGILYVHNGSEFKVGLRSERVDVSEIALKYGGGGHAGASGFMCKELPWLKGD